MRARTALILFCLGFMVVAVEAQVNAWYQWTFLDSALMDEIIGEASGETAWNTILETGGYNKDRPAEEYADTFYESSYIYDQVRRYGLTGGDLVRFPGRQTWDASMGELWEVRPLRQKLASFQDERAMLASGSVTTDVTTQLVWVGRGTPEEIERADVVGKIVVTEGSISRVHRAACQEMGAEGVISIANGRPSFDPTQIPWSGIGGRMGGGGENKFGFFIPPREAESLKARLMAGEVITVNAKIEAEMRDYDLQDIVAYIPGTDPDADEVILSAHLFEGYTKQGANDNKSGSAAILEVARTLHKLIDEGRLPRPRRTIRFLWGPEFSGTGPWVKANKELMEKTLCNINMDMVGEWLSLNQGFMNLMRTSYGNPHYINDVMENYYRFVGDSNRERIQNRSGFFKVPQRIVAPTGSDEPFYYSIETHYGASDHMVFNDWGVQVPGIMMIVWPDRWYHTSGDRVDKADPTQLKRVAIIGAAAAYTIAAADDFTAMKIAGETASNGTRRLGHQFVLGLEQLNNATAETLPEAYRMARAYVEAAHRNERDTLDSIMELADDEAAVGAYVDQMKSTVDAVATAHLDAIAAHMNVVAGRVGTEPVKIVLTELEQRAMAVVPSQTELVKANGYRGYQEFITAVPVEERAKFPYSRQEVANTGEVQLLIDGKTNVYEIKQALDAQNRTSSDLQGIFNFLEVLKLAGLVEF
jgi:aminopeptidase YwaD